MDTQRRERTSAVASLGRIVNLVKYRIPVRDKYNAREEDLLHADSGSLSRASATLRLNASSKCHQDQNSLLIASNICLTSNRPSGAFQWPVRSSAYQFYKVTKRPRCPRIGRLPCYELSSSYPPGSASKSPLKFDVEVIKNAPPSAGQICTILGNLPPVRDVEDPHHVAADDRMTTGSVQGAPGR
jgi:hypothetical protein